jgi:hypothetical protein
MEEHYRNIMSGIVPAAVITVVLVLAMLNVSKTQEPNE